MIRYSRGVFAFRISFLRILSVSDLSSQLLKVFPSLLINIAIIIGTAGGNSISGYTYLTELYSVQ
jgi:hypothetical protein